VDATKGLSIVGSLAGIVALVFYISDRYTGLPEIPRLTRISIILQLGILCAISHGILWSLAEKVFDWSHGASGSDQYLMGWPAVILSATLILPLATVPWLYGKITHQVILLPNHWKAIPWLFLSGSLGHVLMYGTGPNSFIGLMRWVAPPGGHIELGTGFTRELVFAATYFILIAFTYRLIVTPPSASLLFDVFVGRTILPALVFVLAMTVIIVVRYPASLNEATWIQIRGVLSGLLLPCCLCAGMFI